MSVNRFFCAICGAALTIREGSKRRTTECPDCMHVVPVPAPVDTDFGSDGTNRVLPRGVLALEVKFACPSCDTKLCIDARWEGKGVTCPICLKETTVPRWSSQPQAGGVRLSADEVTFLSQPQETAAGPVAV